MNAIILSNGNGKPLFKHIKKTRPCDKKINTWLILNLSVFQIHCAHNMKFYPLKFVLNVGVLTMIMNFARRHSKINLVCTLNKTRYLCDGKHQKFPLCGFICYVEGGGGGPRKLSNPWNSQVQGPQRLAKIKSQENCQILEISIKFKVQNSLTSPDSNLFCNPLIWDDVWIIKPIAAGIDKKEKKCGKLSKYRHGCMRRRIIYIYRTPAYLG